MRGGPAALVGSAWLLALACGRTGLWSEDVTAGGGADDGVDETPVDACAIDADCPSDDACTPGVCQPPDATHAARYCATRAVSCDDGDPCTADRCDLDDGRCVHEGAGDEDHDGVRGRPLPGMPASCGGSDCDDDDPHVFPGAAEICDGKDNDCNGVIDDGAGYATLGMPALIAPSSFQSEAGGFAFDGTSYALTYTDISQSSHKRSFFELLTRDGTIQFGPSPVSEINADTTAGALATSGKAFFTSWADARQSANYEIYGTRFDPMAQKLEADQRLTDAPDFSIQPSATFTGTDYRIVWEDQRFTNSGGVNAIFARKITLDGHADGDEVRLTGNFEDADFPDSAVSEARLGVTYLGSEPPAADGSGSTTSVRFRSFDLGLSDDSDAVELGTNGQQPTIVRTNETFVVAWQTGDATSAPGGSLQAAVIGDPATILSVGSITTGDAHARTGSLVSLGDRVLVVWSAMPTDSSPYQLYYEIISARDLSVLTPRQLLAASSSDLINPHAQLGPNGDVGVVYDDSTTYRGFFTHLGCQLALIPPPRP